MGKQLIIQRRGKGSPTFRAPTHRSIGEIGFRTYDKKEREFVIYGEIKDIVHDTFHTAPLMIVEYEDNSTAILPAPEGVRVGQRIMEGAMANPEVGNVLPLKYIPDGTKICNIEINPGDGGKIARASGTYAVLLQKTEKYAIVQLPSKKIRHINLWSRAIIGTVAGGGRTELPFVKAGNKYYKMSALNRYWPVVSAVCKNARDHPFGGKHSRNKGGNVPVPKKGYPLKYGYIGPKRTGKKK